MNELLRPLGYSYNFWGPSWQFVYLTTKKEYYKPIWYCLVDHYGLLRDLSSLRYYTPNSYSGISTSQICLPWGEIYTL